MSSMRDSKTGEKMVILEGKGRLPVTIQEMFLDFAYALNNVQNPPLNSNEVSLPATIKNFAALDVVLENSINTLKKADQSVDKMLQRNSEVDNCIDRIGETQDRFQFLEREAYYSSKSSSNDAHIAVKDSTK